MPRSEIGCTVIGSYALSGHRDKYRHVAEADDGRLLLVASDASDETSVVVRPFTIEQGLATAERAVSGDPAVIAHPKTLLGLATTLLALHAAITGSYPKQDPGADADAPDRAPGDDVATSPGAAEPDVHGGA